MSGQCLPCKSERHFYRFPQGKPGMDVLSTQRRQGIIDVLDEMDADVIFCAKSGTENSSHPHVIEGWRSTVMEEAFDLPISV